MRGNRFLVVNDEPNIVRSLAFVFNWEALSFLPSLLSPRLFNRRICPPEGSSNSSYWFFSLAHHQKTVYNPWHPEALDY